MELLNNGNFYFKNENNEYEKIFGGRIETLDLTPINEEIDFTNERYLHNIRCITMGEPVPMICMAKLIPENIKHAKIKPSDPYTISQCYYAQRKKHHKIRINKKWAKRYGYSVIEDVYEILDLQPDKSSLASEVVRYDGTLRFKERIITK